MSFECLGIWKSLGRLPAVLKRQQYRCTLGRKPFFAFTVPTFLKGIPDICGFLMYVEVDGTEPLWALGHACQIYLNWILYFSCESLTFPFTLIQCRFDISLTHFN